MNPVEAAIRHAVQAGKLRAYAREHGQDELGGFMRLAERHSTAARLTLERVVSDGKEPT